MRHPSNKERRNEIQTMRRNTVVRAMQVAKSPRDYSSARRIGVLEVRDEEAKSGIPRA